MASSANGLQRTGNSNETDRRRDRAHRVTLFRQQPLFHMSSAAKHNQVSISTIVTFFQNCYWGAPNIVEDFVNSLLI